MQKRYCSSESLHEYNPNTCRLGYLGVHRFIFARIYIIS
uniref:Uncharacterized protein n=1 Tax=Anguilla anguilla TaxID=7936 RepID=A0A0E9V5H3_ANGAN